MTAPVIDLFAGPVRRCPKCTAARPLHDFARNAARPDGLAVWCKPCNADAQRARARRDPARHAAKRQASDRKSRRGVTQDQYDAMLAAQGGVCAICRVPHPRTLHVDHCHTTDVVRGLLCDRCNRGIGYFRDDPERLRRAVAYLERTP